jgi:hypothetical protein
VTSSVSGNVVGCSCFRIMALSCGVLSADVHGRMPLVRAVVTRLVTHIGTGPSRQIGVKARLMAWPTAPEAVGRLCLWLRGWQAHMTYGPRLVREHRTADRLPGRLALPLLMIRYQSDIILIDGSDGRHHS